MSLGDGVSLPIVCHHKGRDLVDEATSPSANEAKALVTARALAFSTAKKQFDHLTAQAA